MENVGNRQNGQTWAKHFRETQESSQERQRVWGGYGISEPDPPKGS